MTNRTDTHTNADEALGFGVLPKDTLAFKVVESGINPPTFQLVNDPIRRSEAQLPQQSYLSVSVDKELSYCL